MLNLEELGNGQIPTIPPVIGNYLAEAAGICLETQGHSPGVRLVVRGHRNSSHSLSWLPVTEQAFEFFQADRATEIGAEGLAVLVAEKVIGTSVIECSWKGTGFDFWMGIKSGSTFQRKARLEVSGIRQGDDSTVRTRAKKKIKQTEKSDEMRLPAYVIVVEFGRPLAQVDKK